MIPRIVFSQEDDRLRDAASAGCIKCHGLSVSSASLIRNVMRLGMLMRDPQAVERFASGVTSRAPAMTIALIALFASCHVHPQQVMTADIVAAEQIVEPLRELPTPLPHVGTGVRPVGQLPRIPPSEVLRDASYRELHRLGPAGVTALARAYSDADVRLRRNVALAFLVLARGIWPGLAKLDVSLALPELITALSDDDPSVRAWSAQAIGIIGADARPAVPALIRLLEDTDEGPRNSACIALRGIGPAATSALPALRRALSDRSPDVSGFARRAILAIDGEP